MFAHSNQVKGTTLNPLMLVSVKSLESQFSQKNFYFFRTKYFTTEHKHSKINTKRKHESQTISGLSHHRAKIVKISVSCKTSTLQDSDVMHLRIRLSINIYIHSAQNWLQVSVEFPCSLAIEFIGKKMDNRLTGQIETTSCCFETFRQDLVVLYLLHNKNKKLPLLSHIFFFQDEAIV